MSNLFNQFPITAHNLIVKENRNGSNLGQVVPIKGTASATAGAATLHAPCGTITSESITTAAGATYTLTLTNRFCNTGSVVVCTADPASSAGSPAITAATATAGQVVIKVQNVHASAAFNNSIKVHFVVY